MAAVAEPSSSKNNRSGSTRVRDTDSPGAPTHVSGAGTGSGIPKSTRQTLPPRPSTSGGTPSKKTLDRRQINDDLRLNPLKAHQIGPTNYAYPSPGSSPRRPSTPKTSRSAHKTAPTLVSVPSPSVSSRKPTMEIGMALGSPSQFPSSGMNHYQGDHFGRTDTPESLDQLSEYQSTQSRPKPSKWKSFFGKKQKESPVFYQLQNGDPEAGSASARENSTTMPADRSRSRSNPEHKGSSAKASLQTETAFLDFEFATLVKAQTSKTLPRTPQIMLDGGPLLNVDIPSVEMERYSIMFGSVLKTDTSKAPSGLLARRQATLDKLKSVNDAIAEHERKEAELKIKTQRARRGTSPAAKSPALTLFPSSVQREPMPQTTPRGLSPFNLQRSNTSPAALSPLRQTFAHNKSENSNSPEKDVHTIIYRKKSESAQDELETSATLSAPWSPDNSHLFLSEPSPASTIDEIYDPAPLKPRLTEPTWDMIPRAIPTTQPKSPSNESSTSDESRNYHAPQSSASTTGSSAEGSPASTVGSSVSPESAQSSSHNQSKTRKRAQSSTQNYNQLPSPTNSNKALPIPISVKLQSARTGRLVQAFPPAAAPLQSSVDALARADAVAEGAAAISIARQISVSQRQRQLLVPIAGKIKSPTTRPVTKGRSHTIGHSELSAAGAAFVSKPLDVSPITSKFSYRESNDRTSEKKETITALRDDPSPSVKVLELPKSTTGSLSIPGSSTSHSTTDSSSTPPISLMRSPTTGSMAGSVRAARLAAMNRRAEAANHNTSGKNITGRSEFGFVRSNTGSNSDIRGRAGAAERELAERRIETVERLEAGMRANSTPNSTPRSASRDGATRARAESNAASAAVAGWRSNENNERAVISERKVLTPTVVVANGQQIGLTVGNAEQKSFQGHMYRKSERVVIEEV